MGGDRNIGRCRVIRKKIEMDDEKLIDCVRRNPSLYELDHKQYGSGVSRAKTWKAIGAELKRHREYLHISFLTFCLATYFYFNFFYFYCGSGSVTCRLLEFTLV